MIPAVLRWFGEGTEKRPVERQEPEKGREMWRRTKTSVRLVAAERESTWPVPLRWVSEA